MLGTQKTCCQSVTVPEAFWPHGDSLLSEKRGAPHITWPPRFYRCMCMCALLSLVLRSMIGIFIGILNGLILEASSISSRPKLLISLTWQVSISDKNCLLARIPLAASPDQLFDLFHCCRCRWRSSSSDKCTVYDLGNFTLNCNFWI